MGSRLIKEPNATYFAPAARASKDDLARTIRQVADNELLTRLMAAMGGLVMIINEERQIVGVNAEALKAFGLTTETLEQGLGLRPGESLGCLRIGETPNGCGTGRACASCGIARAILDAQLNQHLTQYEGTLRIKTPNGEDVLDYRARVIPLPVGQSTVLVLTLEDIADRKRREALERVFLHDMTNTLSALSAYRTLTEHELVAKPQFLSDLGRLIDQALEEIHSQRALLDAEHHHLALALESVDTLELLRYLLLKFEQHECRRNRLIELDDSQLTLITDRAILLRVLTNMLKNALEATADGETVRIRCYQEEHTIVFATQNPGTIPDYVTAHIFERSFSTKGESGRGLGTYAMKLFAERYLGGKVTFTSTDTLGTEFTLRLPERHPSHQDNLVRTHGRLAK